MPKAVETGNIDVMNHELAHTCVQIEPLVSKYSGNCSSPAGNLINELKHAVELIDPLQIKITLGRFSEITLCYSLKEGTSVE